MKATIAWLNQEIFDEAHNVQPTIGIGIDDDDEVNELARLIGGYALDNEAGSHATVDTPSSLDETPVIVSAPRVPITSQASSRTRPTADTTAPDGLDAEFVVLDPPAPTKPQTKRKSKAVAKPAPATLSDKEDTMPITQEKVSKRKASEKAAKKRAVKV